MTELDKYIQTYFEVGKEDLSKISAFFKPITLNKGDFFLKSGRYSDRLGFVQSGIIREFAHIDNKDVTKWISTKDILPLTWQVLFSNKLLAGIYKH